MVTKTREEWHNHSGFKRNPDLSRAWIQWDAHALITYYIIDSLQNHAANKYSNHMQSRDMDVVQQNSLLKHGKQS